MFGSSLAPSLNLSLNLPFFLSFLRDYPLPAPQVLGHAELRSRGRDMSLNRCCRQNTVVSQPQQLKMGSKCTRRTGMQVNSLQTPEWQIPTLSPQDLVPEMFQICPSTRLIPSSFRPWKKLMPWPQWTPDHRARLLMEQEDRREGRLPGPSLPLQGIQQTFPGQKGPGSAKAAGEELGLR